MLRASSAAVGNDITLDAIAGSENGDGNVECGALLSALVEAVTSGGAAQAEAVRHDVAETMSPAHLVDALAVVANFEMMTRVADCTGAAFAAARREQVGDTVDSLGLGDLTSAR